jgi:hypothetical protein
VDHRPEVRELGCKTDRPSQGSVISDVSPSPWRLLRLWKRAASVIERLPPQPMCISRLRPEDGTARSAFGLRSPGSVDLHREKNYVQRRKEEHLRLLPEEIF